MIGFSFSVSQCASQKQNNVVKYTIDKNSKEKTQVIKDIPNINIEQHYGSNSKACFFGVSSLLKK